ncbi:GTPase domain-containing protein [Aquincola sp. S2]|uniref:GTPase domain-containing protein n=1 Tax=Pseudaquabacterium terrae TaxID=2732868 RepID=A0ABX2EQ64_9BURK|nr:GTPase domain-containing protein [Aquabacterium terrae]NRF70709.1 GTPase domain-containing protein [Aquabacterium terrae]
MTPTTALRLSLVSHTNVGKTTLARTLLGRDIGEVRDAPHVTEFAEMNVLLETAAGDQLQLWDTPGFGDSVRLLRRLQQRATPLGWFLAEVWDRWRDRPFWSSQQALRHVHDASDIVLYLVNAAESVATAGYVKPELELLSWLDKPVIVLLNQMGAPRAAADERADVERWRVWVAAFAQVRDVLPLDAFARCWVQEGALLEAIGRALGGDARLQRLHAEWARQRLARFDAAMHELATSLGRIAAARAPLDDGDRGLERFIPGRRRAASAAERRLAEALDAEVRASTARLLTLHAIDGRATGAILKRVASQVQLRKPVGEPAATLVGGVVGGALSGLAADLMAGGLTLGGGMLAGGILGALGAAGAARAINVVRGTGSGFAAWSDSALAPIVQATLLRYLAVAHFGRGRGEWVDGEAPAHWTALVDELLAAREPALAALWAGRATTLDNAGEAERLGTQLQPLLAGLTQALLERLYPGSWPAAS